MEKPDVYELCGMTGTSCLTIKQGRERRSIRAITHRSATLVPLVPFSWTAIKMSHIVLRQRLCHRSSIAIGASLPSWSKARSIYVNVRRA